MKIRKLSKLKLNKFVISELEHSKLSQIKGGYGDARTTSVHDSDCCQCPESWCDTWCGCNTNTSVCDGGGSAACTVG